MEMKPLRSEIDVSRLPTEVFGSRQPMFWGTLGFMVIEGWTIALAVASLFYLRQNFQAWPPLNTPRPSLLIPTINLVVMLASIAPTILAERAAKRCDKGAARLWLVVSATFGIAYCVLRWFEFGALNTRWDSNAYGSVIWTIVGLHATLLVLEAGETIGMAFALFRENPVRTMTDVADDAAYWYFVVLFWVPLYVIVYLLPWIRT